VTVVAVSYSALIFNLAHCVEVILCLLSLWLSLFRDASHPQINTVATTASAGMETQCRYSYGPIVVQRKFEFLTYVLCQMMPKLS
jgi:hypothetical protein